MKNSTLNKLFTIAIINIIIANVFDCSSFYKNGAHGAFVIVSIGIMMEI